MKLGAGTWDKKYRNERHRTVFHERLSFQTGVYFVKKLTNTQKFPRHHTLVLIPRWF